MRWISTSMDNSRIEAPRMGCRLCRALSMRMPTNHLKCCAHCLRDGQMSHGYQLGPLASSAGSWLGRSAEGSIERGLNKRAPTRRGQCDAHLLLVASTILAPSKGLRSAECFATVCKGHDQGGGCGPSDASRYQLERAWNPATQVKRGGATIKQGGGPRPRATPSPMARGRGRGLGEPILNQIA